MSLVSRQQKPDKFIISYYDLCGTANNDSNLSSVLISRDYFLYNSDGLYSSISCWIIRNPLRKRYLDSKVMFTDQLYM